MSAPQHEQNTEDGVSPSAEEKPDRKAEQDQTITGAFLKKSNAARMDAASDAEAATAEDTDTANATTPDTAANIEGDNGAEPAWPDKGVVTVPSIAYAQSIARLEQAAELRASQPAPAKFTRPGGGPSAAPKSLPGSFPKKPVAIAVAASLFAFAGYYVVNHFGAAKFSDDQAGKFLAQKKYDLALDETNKALQVDANHAQAYYLQGCIYQAQRKYDEAMSAYRKALAIEPENSKFKEGEASLYADAGMYDKSIDAYSDLLSKKDDATILTKRGNVYSKSGQFAKAIDDFDHSVRLGDKNPQNLEGDAFAYSHLKKYVQAISFYDSIIRNQPRNFEALLHRAWCNMQLSRDSAVFKDIAEATRIAPTSALPAYYESMYWRLHNDKKKEMALLDKAIQMDPKLEEAYQVRAEIHLANRDYPKAYADYALLSKFGSLTTKSYFDLGLLCQRLNKPREAANAFGAILKLDPKNTKALIGKAAALIELKQIPEALTDCNLAIQQASNDPQAFILRGRCEEAQGSLSSANNDYTTAIALDTKNASTYVTRGQLYMVQKDYVSALSDFQKAMQLNPSIPQLSTKVNIASAAVHKMNTVTIDSAVSLRRSSTYTAQVLAKMDKKELLSVGYQKLKEGKFTDAIALLKEAVVRDPNDTIGRKYLAHAFALNGDYQSASAQFEALASVAPLEDADLFKQADMYRLSQQWDKAEEAYIKLSLSHPTSAAAIVGLARSYAGSGKSDQALQVCQDAMHKPATNTPAVRDAYSEIQSTAQATPKGTNKDAVGKGLDTGG